ncbi:hypothetical protein SAMN05421846_105163 [Chryseobacterium taeanense]|uniref:Uncharacterized protein n=1 Tax=Chryseobacterium taeanense TaxID=311334 RepID=A0A1G8IZL7_9FLAO|nr:hypothetical protein [Chryseobacterium taeanense]SDI24361.1 hypothetical protein SAMN05421846_105163 [Chryseobacterium taeanense]
MKTAKPVEVDNKAHKNPGKKQRPKDPVVMPFSEVEAGNIQTQKSGDAIIKPRLSNQDNNRLGLNGAIASVHGSQSIYDQGSEIMYGRYQDSLKETGDINHPDTKDMEKGYIATLNVAQVQDYHNIKSGNYLPKTMQEQAEVHQESKKDQDVKALKPEPKTKPEEKSSVETKDKAEEQSTEAAPSPNAQNNPEFTKLSSKIAATAQSQKSHEPAKKASNDAQAAAPSPANERESMAQAGQVGYMDDQKPGTFSKVEFKALLKQKIEGIILPKDEASADDFENNNNIQQVNKNAVADVKNEKNAAINDIASATAAKPNVAAQPVRTIAKMPTPNIGKAPGIPNAGKAMPNKRDSISVEKPLREETNTIDSEMKAHGVTDQMLANSNEPSFTEALDEKNKAKKESAAATENFRNAEKNELSKTRDQAQSQAAHHIAGMHNARKGGLNHAHGEQKNTATKDSQKRKEIADHINSIYIDSKKDVDSILNKLDKKVAEMFEYGSKIAKKAFEDHVDKGMSAYKKKRYGDAYAKYGALATAGLWLWDKATGLPEEVNEYFVSGKALYIDTMDHYIDDIATHVTNQLNAAKTRIAKGKKDVQTYVNSLSPSLRKIGKEAIADIQNKFNALEESVNSKKDALIDVLAKKYAENVASIDARIEELKAQNSGFINKALNALSGVFAFIIEIKNTLTNLLAGIVDVVMAIIADPIGFFKNLIAGVGQGFANFGANIWSHLKTGFFTWLTGATKGIDLTMPEDIFSLKGIFSITTQVLGLTWNGIRAIGSRVVGEPVMKVLETSFEMVQIVRKEGAAGLWEHLKEQFADLKATIMDTIMDMIQTQVIQAGIKWIMGLLTPVGAFIKVAMAIIDVVKFFIQRAAQIMELIKAFIDSVAAIASGNVSAVAKSIENALGKAVPVLIGFLASLLGIGGLADKVLGVIRKIRQRIENAIVKFWTFVKGKAKGLLGKIGVGKLRSDKKEDVDTIPDGKEKLFAKLRNNEEKINVDGGHRLKFENEGELAVYSTRIGFNELLRQKQEEIHANKTSSDYSKKQDALNKLNIDKKNFGKELSKYIGKHDKKYSANVKEEYNAMKDILVSVASSLEIIGVTSLETTSLLPTNVTHTTQGKKAKQVIAQPLTKIPGNTHGSSPGSSVPVGWEQIDPDQRSDFWVRAHLLNHHLHGPGVEWNLFPAHKDINKGMELAVENPAKKAVAGKDNKSYFYETNLTYGASDFPTHIKVEFGEYDVKKGKRTPSPYGFDKPLEIPEPYTVNINTATAARLQQVAKANEVKGMTGFFKELVNERNKNGVFDRISDVRLRMSGIAKDSHIENLRLLTIENKLRFI